MLEKIKIVTDSTADLPKSIVEKYDIEVIPLLVNIEENTYKDGVDIFLRELLDRMDKSEAFPTTSQINPQRFLEYYKKYLNEGYKIVSIHLSSKMSGTYQSACIARDMLDTANIVVIDSLNVTSGLGILAVKASILKEKGISIDEIEIEIKNTIPHVKAALAFEHLDNLVKGGRLSKTAGVIGNILGIRPILGVVNGEMTVIDKVRGSRKAARYIIDYMNENGIQKGEPMVLLQVENDDVRLQLKEYLCENGNDFMECEVGCVVGVHAGKGACGVFFIEEY